jgi:hypothetical protein
MIVHQIDSAVKYCYKLAVVVLDKYEAKLHANSGD